MNSYEIYLCYIHHLQKKKQVNLFENYRTLKLKLLEISVCSKRTALIIILQHVVPSLDQHSINKIFFHYLIGI